MSKHFNVNETAAGAGNSRAMEADTILKTRASLKSQMSKRNFLASVSFALLVVFSGCDKDNSSNSNPSDPEGTILVAMRNANNGGTSVNIAEGGYFRISNSDNFVGWGDGEMLFATIGNVSGLGSITTVPQGGWANQVAVIPDYGYVGKYKQTQYNSHTGEYETIAIHYVRIYVVDYLIAAGGSGGVIGAQVKYQSPWMSDMNEPKPPEEPGVPLTDAIVFNLQHPAGTQAPKTDKGITYNQNISATSAEFISASGGSDFVMINKPTYECIETIEELEDAFYFAPNKVDRFTAELTNFSQKCLIVKDGATFRLVEMIGLNFNSDGNIATFTEKH